MSAEQDGKEKNFDMFYIDSRENADACAGPRAARSWELPEDPIPEAEIAETIAAETIIAGGGISGLAAAARCAGAGLDVIVLEKMKGLVAHGAHIACLDSKVMRDKGVVIDKAQFARDWMHICGSRVNEDLLWLYINRSAEAFEWLLSLGGDNIGAALYGGNYRGPDFTEYAGTHIIFRTEGSKYRHGGALLACEILEDAAVSKGARVVRNCVVTRLEKTDGRVTAVLARGEDGRLRRYTAKKGVVLATGDISGNPEMLAAFSPLGLKPARNGSFPKGSNLGEGHILGLRAGGVFEDPPWALSLHLIAYSLYIFFFLHVNRRGCRFMNEDTWAQAKSIRCLMQPQGDYAFSVFDSKWFEEVAERAGETGGQFTDPLICFYGDRWDNEHNNVKRAVEAYIQKGIGFRADTTEELAELMGVPAENLVQTVARYNELTARGEDVDYGKRASLLTSIDKPPYYALKWGPALLTVFGGLLTDVKLRVLDKAGDPIPGLFATGNVAGGICGVDYPLLLNGNSHGRALTWALVLAESLTEA
jgi:succinate dehydrogenase/fumarate reductase flavoprotein subunit